jgi:hypothetical protein
MTRGLDHDFLELVAEWFGDPEPLWKDGRWLCYDADNYGIVIETGRPRIEVFFGIFQNNRSGNGPDFVCDAADDALKFLLYSAGTKWRQRRGMDRILVPYSRELARPGFSITPTPEGVWGQVAWTSGGAEHAVTLAQDGHAVEFTYYGAASLSEIRQSMESPDGAPLFAAVRKVPAASPEYGRP